MSATGILRLAEIASLTLVAGASLTACQKKAAGDVTGFSVTQSASIRTEDQFGKGFGKAFRAPKTAEPVKVSDSDVIPLSRTAEPISVK